MPGFYAFIDCCGRSITFIIRMGENIKNAVCSVFVLLVGSIPQYGALTPGGLVTWAGQLAIGETLAPNVGALATSLVLVLLALIIALAVFEKQEV